METQVQYRQLYERQMTMSGEKEESLVKVQKLRRALRRLRREQQYTQKDAQKRGSWWKSLLSRLGLNRTQEGE